MRVILIRHGNTFEKGQPSRFVGVSEDNPITFEGEEQARQIASELQRRNVVPTQIYASPLKRTTKTAEIIASAFRLNIKNDLRLVEINYGKWANLTEAEVLALSGSQALTDWKVRGTLPADINAEPAKQEIIKSCKEFLDYLVLSAESHETIAVVSSNGRLRWLYDLYAENSGRSLRTGAYCILEKDLSTSWRVIEWDRRPAESIAT